MADTPLTHLRVHARQAPWNARGLAAHATLLVDSAGMRPTNAAARAELSARAIRFYVATGLLDRPDGRGTAATYGYKHLVQLLAIKIRQREGQTLGTIKEELAQYTGDALERRVAQSLAPSFATIAPAGEATTSPMSWKRVTVAPGVELHVRSDSSAAEDQNVEALVTALKGILVRSARGDARA